MKIKRAINEKRIIPLRPVIESNFYRPDRDGVTYSLLSTFLDCREKARLYLQGWSSDQVSFALAFGSVSHRLMQLAYHPDTRPEGVPTKTWVANRLDEIEDRWKQQNPHPSERAFATIQEVMAKAMAMFPTYFTYWKEDFDPQYHQWIGVEQTFKIPVTVVTRRGRKLETFLRGRQDGAFTHPTGKNRGRARLFETKTRSQVDETDIIDTMPYNRQVNLYLEALRRQLKTDPAAALLNIVRKPLLRQKTGETWAQFTRRIELDVQARPAFYFTRMQMTVEKGDIDRSTLELEDMIADFLMWWAGESGHYKNDKSCIMYGRRCDFIKVCGSQGKNFTGLTKRDVVFRELEDE